jgi:FixJ family two-component response regulator/DNA-binding transcriptional LysR family regulator
MDTLTSIKVFQQVVGSGSFVKAAERLDLSTAMVSKHVMHAEKRLGVRLLNRNSRGLSLTEPGRVYFERSKSILGELQATELELVSVGGVPRGSLRVSVPRSASGRWLADLLVDYRRRYPDVLVDVSFEDRFVSLVEEGYDLALRVASSLDSLPPGLIARPLRPAMFYLAASKDYVKRRGAPKSPEELLQHDFVSAGEMLSGVPRAPAAAKGETQLRVVRRYQSIDGVANAVAAGIGIGPVPAVLFEDPAFREVFTPILPDYPLRQATLYVVYASGKFVPRTLRTFVDLAIEILSSAGESTPQVLQVPSTGLRSPSSATTEASALRRPLTATHGDSQSHSIQPQKPRTAHHPAEVARVSTRRSVQRGGEEEVDVSMCAAAETARGASQAIPVVCIVDADVAVRMRFEALVRKAGWRPRAFGSAEELLADPLEPCPACVIVDVDLPGLSGLQLQSRLAEHSEISIIFASTHPDVRATVGAMKAGAVDFLIKPVASESLLKAIVEGIERNREHLAIEQKLRSLRTRYETLSSREREVMSLVIRGRMNKQVAAALGISEITVKAHRGRVMRKMRVDSLADLVRAGDELRNAIPYSAQGAFAGESVAIAGRRVEKSTGISRSGSETSRTAASSSRKQVPRTAVQYSQPGV